MALDIYFREDITHILRAARLAARAGMEAPAIGDANTDAYPGPRPFPFEPSGLREPSGCRANGAAGAGRRGYAAALDTIGAAAFGVEYEEQPRVTPAPTAEQVRVEMQSQPVLPARPACGTRARVAHRPGRDGRHG